MAHMGMKKRIFTMESSLITILRVIFRQHLLFFCDVQSWDVTSFGSNLYGICHCHIPRFG